MDTDSFVPYRNKGKGIIQVVSANESRERKITLLSKNRRKKGKKFEVADEKKDKKAESTEKKDKAKDRI